MAMTAVPLPAGMKSVKALPKQRELVVNMVKVGAALVPRPGMVKLADVLGACRGGVFFGGYQYFVMGDRLVRYEGNGQAADVGEVSGSSRINAVSTPFGAMLVDSAGGGGYLLSNSGLTQITDPNFAPSSDCAYVDGYFIAVPVDGGPVQRSASTDALTWPADGFFDAELLPDRNNGCRNLNNDLYVMGAESIEVFRTTGDSTMPIGRVGGASINAGLLSGHSEYADTFVWLGRRRGHDFNVFALSGGGAEPIGNEAVNELLNTEYTVDELRGCFCNRFSVASVEVVTFHLPRHVLAYYGGWAIFETGTDEVVPWAARLVSFVDGQFLAGADGAICKLAGWADIDDDYQVGFDTFIRKLRGETLQVSSFELDCLTGQEASDYRVSLQTSEDGRIWGPRFWVPLGATGKYRQRVCFNYPGGLGSYESFCGLRVRTSNNVQFALDSAQADIR